MHEQLPGLRESICGQTLRSDWPEGLLAHHPDSEGKGGCCDLLLLLDSKCPFLSVSCAFVYQDNSS